ncbi:hypothetical protein [Nostoc sp. CMAA1605]|uniref:hypothetical protein n=1 Tax=Nostoc sp. CMAA1605 TaxID=2055159 RepID=UPI001F2564C1|nr:hypothetical protein [Nostoc sp. CMAA1605]MCF4969478.1 hypothetical protein [Nostoc sp. CMAA1605]
MTDLSRLKWSKNVTFTPSEITFWDFPINELSKIFILHWKKGYEANAARPEEGDILLIRQHARITHVVQLFNKTVYDDASGYEFSIGRLVQILWKANNLNHAPHNTEIFGCPIKFPPNGKAHFLENIGDFNEHWNQRGGLPAFQNYVTGVLNEKGEWLNPLIALA